MEECQDILLSQNNKWLGNKCSIPFVQNKHTNKDYKDRSFIRLQEASVLSDTMQMNKIVKY